VLVGAEQVDADDTRQMTKNIKPALLAAATGPIRTPLTERQRLAQNPAFPGLVHEDSSWFHSQTRQWSARALWLFPLSS